MRHAILCIERVLILRTHRVDARLQAAGYLLMGRPSDGKLVVRKKELMVKHTYQ
jgi:hypothetical protein